MKATAKVVGMVAGGRQHVVAHTRYGDPVLLIPEPTNAYDPNAIAVYTAPRATLLGPVVSSIKQPPVGSISDEDRALFMDRQAGYLPKELAARLALPATGVVGFVSDVRWAPPEHDNQGREREPRVAGFDVTAWLTNREAADA